VLIDIGRQLLPMFSSLLGTWIPFALIFAATYFTGRWSVASRTKGAGEEQKAVGRKQWGGSLQNLKSKIPPAPSPQPLWPVP
jgi:hypothetical protein